MPMYTYRCPECHDQTIRIVRRSEADEQRCNALLPAHPFPATVGLPRRYDPPSYAPQEENTGSALSVCNAKLVRPEVELTARTPEAWRT